MGEVARCPCCGQEIQTSELLISLQSRSVSFSGDARQISGLKTNLLTTLARAWPETVAHETLVAAAFGAESELADPLMVLRVHISKLRQIIGGELKILNVRGMGYRLVLPQQGVVNRHSVRRRQSESVTI